jgi:hypothetical protein
MHVFHTQNTCTRQQRLITRTLEFAYVLNVGIVHKGTPFFYFSIFALLHAFFGIFLQNWNLRH